MTDRPLTYRQRTVLGILADNSRPASVADIAGDLLITDSSARSTLNSLERRGLVGRTYTGHHRGGLFAFTTTRKGDELAESLFSELDTDRNDS